MTTNTDRKFTAAAEEILSQLPDIKPRPRKPRAQPQQELSDFARSQGFRVTSTTGGRHNRGSKHYAGQAIDVGTREKSPAAINQFITSAQARGYRVRDERQRPARQRVWGGPHLHLEHSGNQEFDPFEQAVQEILTQQAQLPASVSTPRQTEPMERPVSSAPSPDDEPPFAARREFTDIPELPPVLVPVKKVALPTLPDSSAEAVATPQAVHPASPAKRIVKAPTKSKSPAVPNNAALMGAADEASAEAETPFVLKMATTHPQDKPITTPPPKQKTASFFTGEELRPIHREQTSAAPDERASMNAFALRLNPQDAARFQQAGPEQKRRMLIGAYVNSLPEGDREAAFRVIDRLRSYEPEQFDRALDEQNSLRDVDPRVATWAKLGDKEITLSVDTLILELIQAHKDYGPRGVDVLLRMRQQEREQYGREQEEKERENVREQVTADRDWGYLAKGAGMLPRMSPLGVAVDTIRPGTTAPLTEIGVQGVRSGLSKTLAGVEDLAGATAGRFGLPALDRHLTDRSEQQEAMAARAQIQSEIAANRGRIAPFARDTAFMVGELLPVVAASMATGNPAASALVPAADTVIKGRKQNALETLTRATIGGYTAGLSGGSVTSGLPKLGQWAATQGLPNTPEVARWATLEMSEQAKPGSIAPQQLEQVRMEARNALIATLAGAVMDIPRGLRSVDRFASKLGPYLQSLHEDNKLPFLSRLLNDPQLPVASRAIEQAEAAVDEFSAQIQADQKRWKRGELPVNLDAPNKLETAQAQLAQAEQNFDAVMSPLLPTRDETNPTAIQAHERTAPRLEASPKQQQETADVPADMPPQPEYSQMSELDRMAALLMEHAQAGKIIEDIPADITLEQAKAIYQQRVNDFGANSVSAAEAREKVRALSQQPSETVDQPSAPSARSSADLLSESQARLVQHQQVYRQAIADGDLPAAQRSLRQMKAQTEFQLQQEPTTPAEVERQTDLRLNLDDINAEMSRLQNLQNLPKGKRETTDEPTTDEPMPGIPTSETGGQAATGLQRVPGKVFSPPDSTTNTDNARGGEGRQAEDVRNGRSRPEELANTDDAIVREAEDFLRRSNAPDDSVAQQKAAIDQAAHEAATSPLNELPEPSAKQKESGVYRKGHLYLHGLDIAIENPQGSTRSGVDPNGKPWSVEMAAHYGALRRTKGADGDNVDVYIGDHPASEKVFVVDQVDKDTHSFDEHKVILGVRSRAEAMQLYDHHFSDGQGAERRANVTEMSLPQFKDWLQHGDTTKPVATTNSRLTYPLREKIGAALEKAGLAQPLEASRPPNDVAYDLGGATAEAVKRMVGPPLKIGDDFKAAQWLRETSATLREWQKVNTDKKVSTDVGKIRRVNTLMAEGIQAAAAGEQKTLLKKRLEVGRELNRLNKTPLGQAVVGYMKAQVLLALHIVTDNMVSNAASLAANEVRRPLAALTDAAVARAYGTKRTVAGLNPATLKEAAKYGATQGLKESWQMLRYGTSETQLNAREASDKYIQGEMNILPGFDQAANFVFRLMGAGDKPFYAAAFMGAMHGQARLATKGLKGAARRTKIQELLLDPPPEMVEIAKAEAQEATFNRDNKLTDAYRAGKQYVEEKGGALGRSASLLADAMILFDKVPTNVILRAVEMSGARLPFRLVDFLRNRRAGVALTPQEQAAFAQHVGDGVTGLLAFALGGAGLAMAGMLSGDDENRARIRNAKEATGAMDSALRVGNTQINLNKWGGPAGKVMTTAAGVANAYRARPGDEEKSRSALASERIGRSAANALKTMADLPLLRGVQDFTEAAKGDAGTRGGLKRIVENKLTSLVPLAGTGLAKEIGELTDDYKREADNPVSRFKARLPVIREQLPRQIDALGEPVKQRNPITGGRVQQVADMPEAQENLRLQVGLSKPKKGTPEEKAIQLGKANAKALKETAKLLSELPSDTIKRAVMAKLLDSERAEVEAVSDGKKPRSANFARRDQERLAREEKGREALLSLPDIKPLSVEQKQAAEQAYRHAMLKFHGRRATKERSEKLPELPTPSDIRSAQREALRAGQRTP